MKDSTIKILDTVPWKKYGNLTNKKNRVIYTSLKSCDEDGNYDE
jgi:hypothetical protein